MTEDLFVKLDYRCNNNCLFCSIGAKKTFLTFEEFKKLIENSENKADTITISGGEVTIRPDFFEILKIAKEKQYKINIQTNGRAFHDEIFTQKVVKIGVDHFLISFQGHDKKLFEYITNVPNSFEETVQGIQMLKNYGQKITTNTVISSVNYKHLADIGMLLVTLNVDMIKFVYIRSFGFAKNSYSEFCPKFSQVQPFLVKSMEDILVAGGKVMTEGIPFCKLKGYESFVGELYIPNQFKYNDPTYNIEDFTECEHLFRRKGQKCVECNFNSLCLGPWNEYVELYGFEEFMPIQDVNPLDIIPVDVVLNKLF
ncbi:MAG: radical SAM protein [Halanaerobiales bacterium]|nr:radical SAM protein [Halanaerobiales bacterium]